MKTAVLSTDKIDEQMSTDASGEQKMKVGRGSKAASATDDAVKPANATAAARLLQDANATLAGNASNKSDAWKSLPKEEDNMEVIINKKMF
jgi:hypothetical protein